MVHAQRRILRRLCLEAGALKMSSASLARHTLSKAEHCESVLKVHCMLDLAEVLNTRAYMRTYVSRLRNAALELDEAVSVAKRASLCEDAPWPRTGRLLGRTLASAAHARALGVFEKHKDLSDTLEARWGTVGEMFRAAVGAHMDARSAVRDRVTAATDASADSVGSGGGNPAARETGALAASFGECLFCVATAEEYDGQQLLPEIEAGAVTGARTHFEEALQMFKSASETSCVEYADALKDYGKTLSHFFEEEQIGRHALLESFELHKMLFGDMHPRTKNVGRLLHR
eukprot:gnl/TRDRNA2_/TRDRNA2_68279_c0_seq1.p1 gnl/TRDRNA2_/TRDRNA2_68279_c0~~gnl/TRDRNA2_/TRDRNA2_68279_c0_seq1.p1  ORF type:complete len:303 (+),score=54.20 gnl/TRDRNA2_/TRDRNA2_68279_c0_seq1:46-909(+)